MFRWLAGTLAVAVLAPLALPAHAVADQSFTTTGSITYTWHGDPARGCAAEGVCAVQGALILRSQGVSSESSGGPGRGTIEAPFDPTGSTVRVSDGVGAGECVDVASGPGEPNNLVISRGPGGALVGHVQAPLSSGRCAGPLPQDLAALTLPVRRSGGRNPTFDLHGSQSFTAGPFSGSLVSTLVVSEGSTATSGRTGTVVAGPVPVGSTHKVLLERVTLRYRVASLPSALTVSFAGEPDPFCAALGSCGAAGTLALSLPVFRPTIVVQASRTVRTRVDARQAEADLGSGALPANGVFGLAAPGSTARVAETFAGSGGFGCQDTSTNRPAQLFVGAGPSRAGKGVTITLVNQFDADLVRTHCPGPSDADVFGSPQGELARGSLGFPQLLDRRSVISLTTGGAFAGFGYVGRRSGVLRFSLTLEHITAGTVEVTRP